MPQNDIVDEARVAFASYRGYGRSIIDRMIAEIDRLRAENAELRKAAQDVYDSWGSKSPMLDTIRAILAKTPKEI